MVEVYEVGIATGDPMLMKTRHFSAYLQVAEYLCTAELDLNNEERKEMENKGEIIIDATRARKMGIETRSQYVLLRKA
ncbi:MAG: hypothetical protein DSO07_03050 [Thermoproteota archaeon]|jgi:hypothetical protein|uniref:Uncharacterized protein n=2 Tax=Candidatus Methanodesulfokora washburnensis TaxID=2478471 RepID=A0A3R9QXA0_9CREN|nr:hypothetical protein D6D85_05715 [Candidatus Methanodesulfokores washburnensis]RZN62115.1 MAG: hypothetical protein EF810_03580 [Candidatus Methanodesulfokores washburnensis]TDA41720.1 MAG: hypothetical protein DSO07_03050 [Candidatus Korarchaeota archaeon]